MGLARISRSRTSLDLVACAIIVSLFFLCPSALLSAEDRPENIWTAEQLSQLTAELPRLEEDRTMYHWADSRRSMRWVRQGYVDAGEMEFLNKPGDSRQVYGPGLYLSGSPTDTTTYGEMATQIQLRKGTLVYNEAIVRRVLGKSLTMNQQALLGQVLGLARNVTDGWWTLHNASQASEVSSAVAHRLTGKENDWSRRILQKASVPVTATHLTIMGLRDADPVKFGYLASFSTLPRYQDGVSFLRSVQVNPQNPWSEFEEHSFENFQRARDNVYRTVDNSWKLPEYGKNGEAPMYVRLQSSPIGITDGSRFGSGKQTASEWADSQLKILSDLRDQIAGTKTEIRGTPVHAGGDGSSVSRNGGYFKTMRLSESQLFELKQNRFLSITSIPAADSGFYDVTFEYPNLNHWSRHKNMLSKEFVTVLKNANISRIARTSPEYQQLNKKFLDGLMRTTFANFHGQNVETSASLMRDLISIHPAADFNGRSIRLYIEAGEIEANLVPGYHFASDLDLLVAPESYQRIMNTGGTEFQLFEARALNEAVWARNHGQTPDLHRLRADGETLASTFRDSFASIGLPQTEIFTPQQNELIRTRNWTGLMKNGGNPLYDLTDAEAWKGAYMRYLHNSDRPLDAFRIAILEQLPINVANGMKIETSLLDEATGKAPLKTRLAIYRAIAESPFAPVPQRVKAIQTLSHGPKLVDYFKRHLVQLQVMIETTPEIFSEQMIAELREPITKVMKDMEKYRFDKFRSHIASMVSPAVEALRVSLVLEQFHDLAAGYSRAENYRKPLEEVSRLYSLAKTDETKAILRTVVAEAISNRNADKAQRKQLLKHLSPEMREQLIIEELTRISAQFSRAMRINERSARAQALERIPRLSTAAAYFEEISPSGLMDPALQRAERVLASGAMTEARVLKSESSIPALSEAALDARARGFGRLLENVLRSCQQRKRCLDSEKLGFSVAWNSMMRVDPTNPALTRVLSWDPKDIPERVDLNGFLSRLIERPTNSFSKLERTELLRLLSFRYGDTKSVHDALFFRKVADHIGVSTEMILSTTPNAWSRSAVPDDLIRKIVAEVGPTDPRFLRLIESQDLQGPAVNAELLKATQNGLLSVDDLFRLSPKISTPSAEDLPQVLAALKGHRTGIQAVLNGIFSLDSRAYSSAAYDHVENIQSKLTALKGIEKPTFENWNQALKALERLSGFAQSKLTTLIQREQPEIFEELIARNKVGQDVSIWVKALSGTIFQSGSAQAVLKTLIANDPTGRNVKSMVREVVHMSAAEEILKKFPSEKLLELQQFNPELLSQVSVSDKQLKAAVAAASSLDGEILATGLARVCLRLSKPLQSCKITDIAESDIAKLGAIDRALYFDSAIKSGAFSHLEKISHFSSHFYESTGEGLTSEALSKLISYISKNPKSDLNHWYVHILIERSARNGYIFMGPIDHFRFARAIKLSANPLSDAAGAPTRFFDTVYRVVETPIFGTFSKTKRGCSLGFRKLLGK